MASFFEPTWQNIAICSLVLVVSGIVVLVALKRFNMPIASKLFKALLGIVGAYIPFYFLGTLAINAVSAATEPTFGLFFLKHQLATLNAPFFLFESASLIICVIAIIAIVALAIATVLIVKIVATFIAKVCEGQNISVNQASRSFVCFCYVPNYSNTYLFLKHLRN